MGAYLDYVDYVDSLGREAIGKAWKGAVENSLYERGHTYSGSIGMLGTTIKQWVDAALPSQDAAHEYLCNRHKKWDAAMAVSYMDKHHEKHWLIGGWCSS